MKIALCCYSYHHQNTLKVCRFMTGERDVDLIDIAKNPDAVLEGYDVYGFASGIYAFNFHPRVIEFIKKQPIDGKGVFFVYTYGGYRGRGASDAAKAAARCGAVLLGEYGCRGYNTFGPFRLAGGVAKGHPDERELYAARGFFEQMVAAARRLISAQKARDSFAPSHFYFASETA